MPKFKFENPSCSGVDYLSSGFRVYIPGNSVGAKAIIADVPAKIVQPVINKLRSLAPFIIVSLIPPDVVVEVIEPASSLKGAGAGSVPKTIKVMVEDSEGVMTLAEFRRRCRIKRYRAGGLRVRDYNGNVFKFESDDADVAIHVAYQSYLNPATEEVVQSNPNEEEEVSSSQEEVPSSEEDNDKALTAETQNEEVENR
jgi:hypothetical protein